MRNTRLVSWIIVLVVVADQVLKIWVKTHMAYGEEIPILGSTHAILRFEENEGMAFNIQFAGKYGKLILSLFRIMAMMLLTYYLRLLLREKARRGLIVGIGLVLAGAIGNIIDSAFYGMIFSISSPHGGVAELFPAEGGYAPFLYGSVVDMFYFPIYVGTYPDWFPLVGGQVFHFFRPIFNLADVAISIGVLLLLYHFMRGQKAKTELDTAAKEGNTEEE